MKVIAGRLRDSDREILFKSHETGQRVLVATLRACVIYDQRKPTPYVVAPMQAVGVATTWDHDTLTLGGWSFTTEIRWEDVVAVWWREDAPPSEQVEALIAEFAA